MKLEVLTDKVLSGGNVTYEEAVLLANWPDLDQLCDAADKITKKFIGNRVDSCSIVNARSGICGEDCKWCAQSVRYHTGCDTYDFLDTKEVINAAKHNEKAGIEKFSLVTSGRAVSVNDMHRFCEVFNKLHEETNLYLCASMGLLSEDELKQLKKSGVKRYHCNMETSSKVFPKLCSTHKPEDKIRTIQIARKLGMEICSGGIIGMGESMNDRIDFAFELKEIAPDSVPINILTPIKGTPLQDIELISEEDIIRTVAVFRFILPHTSLRFAGGRLRLSHEAMSRIFRGGMNGVLMGDMLTTISNQIDDDRKLFAECGLEF